MERSIKIVIDNSSAMKNADAVKKSLAGINKGLLELEQAGKKGSKEYSKLIEDRDKEAQNLADYNKTVADTLRVLNNLSGATRKELDKAFFSTRNNMRDLSRDSIEYKAYQEQLIRIGKERNKAIADEKVSIRDLGKEASLLSRIPFLNGSLMVAMGNSISSAISSAVSQVKQLIGSAKDWAKESVAMASSAEGVHNAFKKIADPELLKGLREQTKGLISNADLEQFAVRADKAGIPVRELGKALKFAQQRAQETGKSVDYMTDSIIEGWGKESSVVIDNLHLDMAKFKKDVKETGSFSDAMIKTINEGLEQQGDLALTAADRKVQAEVKWGNAQMKVGQRLVKLSDTWNKISASMAESVSNLAGELRSSTEIFDDQISKVVELESEVHPLAVRYDELKTKTELNSIEQAELNGIMNTLANTVGGRIITELGEYGDILSINTEKVYEYIEAEKARLRFMNADAINELDSTIESLQKKKETLEKTFSLGKTSFTMQTSSMGGFETVIRDLTSEEMLSIQKEIVALGDGLLGAQTQLSKISGETLEKQVDAERDRLEARKHFNSMNRKELESWIADEKNASDAHIEIARQILAQKAIVEDDGQKVKTKSRMKNKALLELNVQLETAHQQKMAEIKQQYLDGEIMTEAELNRKLFAQEQAYYLLRETALEEFLGKVTSIELKADIEKQLASIQERRLSQEIDFRKKLEKVLLDADPLAKEMKRYEESLSSLELFGVAKEDMTKEQMDALELLEKEHQDNLAKIRAGIDKEEEEKQEKDFEEGYASRREEMQRELNELIQIAASASGSEKFDAEMAVHMKRLQMIEEESNARELAGLRTENRLKEVGKIEAQLTASIRKENERRSAIYNKYAESLGDSLGQVLSGQKDMMEAFSDSMIDMLFDVLGNIINAKIAEATAVAIAEQAKAAAVASALPDSVMTFGAAGAARTAVISALIMGALQAAKSSLKGLTQKSGAKGASGGGAGSDSYQRVTVDQRRAGKYDVIGADDGRNYSNVPYAGIAQTGVVSKPTLVGEIGSELVVSALDFKALQMHMNYPLILSALQDVRSGSVAQRREGKYDTIIDKSANLQDYNPDNSHLYVAFDRMNFLLEYLADNGVSAKLNAREFERDWENYQQTKNKAKNI